MARKTYPYDPDYVVHPGAMLQEWFEWSGLPSSIAWNVHGFTQEQVEGILAGSEAITEVLARKLDHMTHISDCMWLAFEHNFRAGLKAGLTWTP